jgi:uncharacterized protein (UPF0332 family)
MKYDINIIKEIINKSNIKLLAAKKLYEANLYDDSVSRAYYSIFHSISALLLTKELSFSSHKEIIGNFNKEFIKNNIFPANFSKMIKYLFDNRGNADYDTKIIIDKETAKIGLNNVKIINDECKKYLSILFNVDVGYWDNDKG